MTRSPPTGHTHPPNRQSGSSVAGAQSLLPWQHTPAVAPLDQQPPASCLVGNRDWESPRRRKAARTVKNFFFNSSVYNKKTNQRATGEYILKWRSIDKS